MKVLIVNLSPRQQGTSSMMCKYLTEKIESAYHTDKPASGDMKKTTEIFDLYKNLNNLDVVRPLVQNADSIFMVGPCYVDSFPAEATGFLEFIAKSPELLHGQNLYGFIQGGMPYVHTHESGLRLLRNFAKYNNVVWKGGFVMGGGAALDGHSIDHVIGAKTIVPAVNLFIERIIAGQDSDSSLYKDASVKVPVFLAFILNLFMCNMIRKKLKSLGVDYKQKTPYLEDKNIDTL